MAERQILVGGAVASSPAALAHLLREGHAWRGPFDRWHRIAEGLWALPDAEFGWEVGKIMAGTYTAGRCDECGVGFVDYVACPRSDCKWNPNVPAPVIGWTTEVAVALHKQQSAHDTGSGYVGLPRPEPSKYPDGWGVDV